MLPFLVSCGGNPESDGKKVAEKLCDCKTKATDEVTKSSQNFLNDLQKGKYGTKKEAQVKFNIWRGDENKLFSVCDSLSHLEYDKIKAPYLTNEENSKKFDFAYYARLSDDRNKQIIFNLNYSNLSPNLTISVNLKKIIKKIY